MKCPHCSVEINPDFKEHFLGVDSEEGWAVHSMTCPNPKCKKLIVHLVNGRPSLSGFLRLTSIKNQLIVRPLSSSRPPVPPEVDLKFACDYTESCLVLPFSPKASAALSRRCLQNILRQKAKVKESNLSNEIQEILDSRTLPSHLAESIDAIRNIGNFAAHPTKSTSSGEIIDVETGEAEWLLDVLESLFDFYFVQPEIIRIKKEALNNKLKDAGKPLMK